MDENEIYRDALGKFRADQEKRREEQVRQRREAEAELLEGAKDMREYNEIRDALKGAVYDENVPLDEMTGADYVRMRNRSGR